MFQTKLGQIKDPIERYFAIAKERQTIFLKKESGVPRPWTDDNIYNTFKFCNVYREQDKVTRWFRENVRNPLRDHPAVFLATVLFRWFNRIEIGEIIWHKSDPKDENHTGWERFYQTGDGKRLEEHIRFYSPKGPWVTGSYTITSKPKMDKLSGMCSIAEDFYHGKYPGWHTEPLNWLEVASAWKYYKNVELQDAWKWLKNVPFQGPFHSYEVVTDLRHTALLEQAPDINLWANAGPGCKRGLNRLFSRPLDAILSKDQISEEMKLILDLSRDTKYWPNNEEYPKWEMREVEHQNCEYDKYLRVYESNGARRPRSIYK